MALNTIKADVEAALKRSSWPSHQNISVEVKDGRVTLTGNVHSWTERESAGQTAWSAAGVRNVVNEITLTY